MSETLESRVRALNKEILALKTFQPVFSGIKTFWTRQAFELEAKVQDPYSPAIKTSYYYEITYVEGNQPILTQIGTYLSEEEGTSSWEGMAVLGSPVGNKQKLIFFDWGYGSKIELWFNSSRQILSIRREG